MDGAAFPSGWYPAAISDNSSVLANRPVCAVNGKNELKIYGLGVIQLQGRARP